MLKYFHENFYIKLNFTFNFRTLSLLIVLFQCQKVAMNGIQYVGFGHTSHRLKRIIQIIVFYNAPVPIGILIQCDSMFQIAEFRRLGGARIKKLMPSSTILVTMAVIGNTSRGKYIFLIKAALEVTLLTPSEADS